MQARTQVVEKVGYILVIRGVACASVPSRGVWGHAPPGKFWVLDLLRSFVMQFGVIKSLQTLTILD